MNQFAIIPDQYAVIGNPIHHSKSPLIHTMFAAQTNQHVEYGRILGNAELFAIQVREFFHNGGKGLNVTLPFKQNAWRIAHQFSNRVKNAEAANTLMLMPDGKIFAENTDGLGLIHDLVHNHGIVLKEHSILLLGAGGAARGVISSIIEQEPAYLLIANRTASKAIELANKFNSMSIKKIHGSGLENLHNQHFDIIINATSASLQGQTLELPATCLINGGIVYDMLYANEPTSFMRWGLEHGASFAMDGLGMLVEQAAESFLLWRGVRPHTGAVFKSLR